ncbi:hypothetical protein [Klebsiella grimontii]|uniref:hypothetical protein n=1 Tax=Klebsiella grimontii TaxID=2058152 RepID=UPI0031B728B0
MKFTKGGRTISFGRLIMLALNVAGVIFAFASGVVDNLLGYYAWHWDAERCYEFLMIAVPVINIVYLWFIASDSSLLGMWLKRKRLEEQQRIRDLEAKK